MLNRIKHATHGTQVPWVTLTLTAMLVLFHAIPAGFHNLVYARPAILDGDLWRLATGHLVHLDWNHLTANAVALLGLGWLVESTAQSGRRTLLALLGIGAAAITTALLAFSPATNLYAGLSGILNGVFAYVCLDLFSRTRHKAWLALIFGAGAKIAWESAFGPLFTETLAWPSHTLAHTAGLASGIGLALAHVIARAKRSWYFPWCYCPLNSA